MANFTQIRGSISTDSSHNNLISILEIIHSLEEQLELTDNTGNGVKSTIRFDSYERDGFAIEMLHL